MRGVILWWTHAGEPEPIPGVVEGLTKRAEAGDSVMVVVRPTKRGNVPESYKEFEAALLDSLTLDRYFLLLTTDDTAALAAASKQSPSHLDIITVPAMNAVPPDGQPHRRRNLHDWRWAAMGIDRSVTIRSTGGNQHGLDRYRIHHPHATEQDVMDAIESGSWISQDVMASLRAAKADHTLRPHVEKQGYRLTADQRGAFVLEYYPSSIFVRTYLRFGQTQRSLVAK